ncbi:MAG: methyltransferase domain-containing protein [Bacillota bacterium]
MSNKTNKAYKSSTQYYDKVLTQSNFFARLYIKFFWDGADDNKIAETLLSQISDDFSGTLLDVPVGTAVFTHEKYAKLKNANIICLDYSSDMLEISKSRLENCENISLVQGDVANLPMADNSCDIILSMNGFHVFPDTNKAYEEIHRTLKPQGAFISCFYIKGENKKTDWLVKNILSKKGWFTPPFQTLDDVKSTLEKNYTKIEIHQDGPMVYFKCENI